MQRFLSQGISLLLLTATAGVTLPAVAAPVAPRSISNLPMDTRTQMPTLFDFTAPYVTGSGVLGSNQFIRIAVVGMSVKDLMISIPSQMEDYSTVHVIDQNGKAVPAKLSISKERVAIAFDQPVAPGNTLQVVFTGVQMNSSGGETLFYGVTAERVGLRGEIPVGTARIQIPNRS